MLSRILVVFAGVLALSGGGACSSADQCTAEEPCDEYAGYKDALAHDCRLACSWLERCNLQGRVYNIDRSCRYSCERAPYVTGYWACETSYRQFLACLPELAECDLGPCLGHSDEFQSCLDDPLPSNANSCVLANNGHCDEPDECVPGSDTNDCLEN